MARSNVSAQLTATIFKIKSFYTEGRGSGCLENVGSAPVYRTKTTLHPSGPHCSSWPPCKPRIRHRTHKLKPTQCTVFSGEPPSCLQSVCHVFGPLRSLSGSSKKLQRDVHNDIVPAVSTKHLCTCCVNHSPQSSAEVRERVKFLWASVVCSKVNLCIHKSKGI
jgi:hypothetical protein